jgi:Tat protein translocase TatB subunit
MNLGMSEMIFIAILALVVVGPRRLPELARQLGKYMAEFKRASNEFKHQLEAEMMNIELEERAKKQPEEPKILPPEKLYEGPEKLYETVSFPPGAISRGELDAVSEPLTPSPELPPAPEIHADSASYASPEPPLPQEEGPVHSSSVRPNA